MTAVPPSLWRGFGFGSGTPSPSKARG